MPASASEVARDLVIPGGLAAGAIITAYHALALFVETPLLAWSERVSQRWFSVACLTVLALSTLLAAIASEAWMLALALALYGPASGGAISVSEGLLVESRPDERERTMARINLAGAVGDLGVPVVLGAMAWLGLGWRQALIVMAGCAALLALVHARSPALDRLLPGGTDDGDAEEGAGSVLATLRMAFGTPQLLKWSFAVTLTSLLDEVLIAFAMVRLTDASTLERAIAVGGWTVGLVGGLFVLERWIDRWDGARVLLLASSLATSALALLVWSPTTGVATLAMMVLGVATSPLHPLVSARAYASLPGRPALVNAVASALAPLDALTPLVLAAIAMTWGPRVALGMIALAPLGIGVAALTSRRS